MKLVKKCLVAALTALKAALSTGTASAEALVPG